MIKLVLYEDEYFDELTRLLLEMSESIFGKPMCNTQQFIDYHHSIYLGIIDDEVVGLTSFIINSYYGLRESTVGQTYLYVQPSAKRSRILRLFCIQTSMVVDDMQLSLEHYIASDAGGMLSSRLTGHKLYTVYVYPIDNVIEVGQKLKKVGKK